MPPERLARGTLGAALALAAMALGALLFAGALADDHYAAWPGWIGGVVCAAVAIAATRPLLARVRGRLDRATAATVPRLHRGQRGAPCGAVGRRAAGRARSRSPGFCGC